MAIDRDIPTKTAVSITYTRTGNTLNRRERHGIKDKDGTIHITFDETTEYTGKDGLTYLSNIKNQAANLQESFDAVSLQFTPNIIFLTAQIDEIEALLP